jgi:type IV pilus assembly protein PilW
VRIVTDGPATRTRAARAARGFSLIELMIALTLGLIVTAAVIATFVSVHSASKDTAAIGELADNGRIAIDIMQETLRGAGYMACNSTMWGGQMVVQGGLGVNQSPLQQDFSEALAGYEAQYNGEDTGPGAAVTLSENPPGVTSQGDWTTSAGLGGTLDSTVISEGQMKNNSALPIQGSDAIAVHTTYPQVDPVYTTATSGASSVTVQNTTGLTQGEVGIVSNCAQSVVDEIDSVSGDTVRFDQSLGQSFAAGSQVGVFDTVVFYIGTGRDGDGALYTYSTAGQPQFNSPPTELVPDVENMQILYGIDTNGSMAATEYVTADQVSAAAAGNPDCQPLPGSGPVEFNCVISVKIALLVASPPGAVPMPTKARTFDLLGTQVTAPIDTRMRQVFETTVSLRDTTN